MHMTLFFLNLSQNDVNWMPPGRSTFVTRCIDLLIAQIESTESLSLCVSLSISLWYFVIPISTSQDGVDYQDLCHRESCPRKYGGRHPPQAVMIVDSFVTGHILYRIFHRVQNACANE